VLTTVEKVIFLQDIDIFEHTSTEDLSQIALITEELDLGPEEVIFQEGDVSDAMYFVVDGSVKLMRNKGDVAVAGRGEVLGNWALFDDQPRVVSAITQESSHLLIIHKDMFIDLLADNVRISQSIMKTLVKRLRNLMTRAAI
jgi:CRP-like cAMP-binding protein